MLEAASTPRFCPFSCSQTMPAANAMLPMLRKCLLWSIDFVLGPCGLHRAARDGDGDHAKTIGKTDQPGSPLLWPLGSRRHNGLASCFELKGGAGAHFRRINSGATGATRPHAAELTSALSQPSPSTCVRVSQTPPALTASAAQTEATAAPPHQQCVLRTSPSLDGCLDEMYAAPRHPRSEMVNRRRQGADTGGGRGAALRRNNAGPPPASSARPQKKQKKGQSQGVGDWEPAAVLCQEPDEDIRRRAHAVSHRWSISLADAAELIANVEAAHRR